MPPPSPPCARPLGPLPKSRGSCWPAPRLARWAADDRAYLEKLIAARTGLIPEDVKARVDAVLSRVDEAAQQAKQAAETARKAGATFALVGALQRFI
jgi:hypothetical protein